MNKSAKILVVMSLAMAVVLAVALKNGKTSAGTKDATPAPTAAVASPDTAGSPPVTTAKLPRLLDLGAGKCIPCKMMKPILDDLKANYADRFVTEFIDVWENPDAGRQYGIRAIPTQIFYDAEGRELFRHEGFYGKEDILGKWKELGVDVPGQSSAGNN